MPLILKAQNEVVRNEFSNITKLIESIYCRAGKLFGRTPSSSDTDDRIDGLH